MGRQRALRRRPHTHARRFAAGLSSTPNHKLGLEPGDLVLGYDGVPWRDLYPQLLAAELPIRLRWSWGSTDESMEHAMLISAGMNWHLFDTIDIQKYGSDEVVSLPTIFWSTSGTIWGNEQLPVRGRRDAGLRQRGLHHMGRHRRHPDRLHLRRLVALGRPVPDQRAVVRGN